MTEQGWTLNRETCRVSNLRALESFVNINSDAPTLELGRGLQQPTTYGVDGMPRIMAFAGSARRESFNRKLVATAAIKARTLGADVTLVELADYPIPLFDGDLEAVEGIHDNATKLRQLMLDHDALLIACPEYNGSITPLLKNVIDWTSRPADGVAMSAAYRGKVAGLLSASPGSLGGMRGLVHVRAILSGMGVLVVPGDMSLGGAHSAFSDNGALIDDKSNARLERILSTLISTTAALSSATS